jgi:hypothetical protein
MSRTRSCGNDVEVWSRLGDIREKVSALLGVVEGMDGMGEKMCGKGRCGV